MTKILLEGANNTRDLGGIKTTDNRTIVPNRLIRSGELSKITTDDIAKLTKQHHLQRIVDFRTPEERMSAPDIVPQGVQYILNPILDKAILGITRNNEQQRQDLVGLINAGIEHMQSTGMNVTQYMQAIYSRFVTDSHCLKQYTQFFEILLNANTGATLWHCSAGKDRVGAGTALLLTALGVDRNTIVQDYLLTGEYNKASLDNIVQQLSCDQHTEQLVRQIMGVQPQYIEALLDIVGNTYDKQMQFFADKLNLPQNKIDKLRQMYLS